MRRAWSIVMKRAGNIVMTGFMEDCDERGHGALLIHRLWNIEMTGFM